MKKTFVIVSVSDRVNELNHLVDGIRSMRKFDTYDLCLLFQDYQNRFGEIKEPERYTFLKIVPERMGCHGARVALIREIEYDIYINLDDDMELVEQTNYDNAINKALEPSTGFVLTNWAKTHGLMMAKVPRLRNEFIPQILVYQGGGMVYTERIAELMRSLTIQHTTFDNAWALTAYINGYTNYRDMSSLAVHKVCGTGGMASYMKDNVTPLMCKGLINFRVGKLKDKDGKPIFLIPLDSDVLPLAKLMHKKNSK